MRHTTMHTTDLRSPHYTSARPCAGPLALSAGAHGGGVSAASERALATPHRPCRAPPRCTAARPARARSRAPPKGPSDHQPPHSAATPQDGHGSTEGGQCTELRSMHARVSAARLPCGSLVERPHRSACGSRRQCASGRSAGSSLRSASPQAAVVTRFASTRPAGRHRPHLLGTALAC